VVHKSLCTASRGFSATVELLVIVTKECSIVTMGLSCLVIEIRLISVIMYLIYTLQNGH